MFPSVSRAAVKVCVNTNDQQIVTVTITGGQSIVSNVSGKCQYINYSEKTLLVSAPGYASRKVAVTDGGVFNVVLLQAGVEHYSVEALRFVTDTRIKASAGKKYTIKANGTVNLAAGGGSYIVDANGTILTTPAQGSGAQKWFKEIAAPVGELPADGAKKFMIKPNVTYLENAAYGALVAGF